MTNDTRNMPEGLYLTVNDRNEPVIADAQDHVWITFEDAGVGDPDIWSARILHKTCNALGVTRAHNLGEDTDTQTFACDFYAVLVEDLT